MRATLSKTAVGNIKSKILDPKYKTVELIFEVEQSPTEFAKMIEEYSEKEFEVTIK